MNPSDLMEELEAAARQLDKGSTRLADAIKEYEGSSTNGTWAPGPKILWESLVEAEAEQIFTAYEKDGKKPPPEAIRDARARAKAKAENPNLWADYTRLRSEVENLQKWIGSKKDAVSARQSVLSAEKALLSIPAGRS